MRALKQEESNAKHDEAEIEERKSAPSAGRGLAACPAAADRPAEAFRRTLAEAPEEGIQEEADRTAVAEPGRTVEGAEHRSSSTPGRSRTESGAPAGEELGVRRHACVEGPFMCV